MIRASIFTFALCFMRYPELSELERKYDGQFQIGFEALQQLIAVEEEPERKAGFIARESRATQRAAAR